MRIRRFGPRAATLNVSVAGPPAALLEVPAPETITVPAPGTVTGSLAVPFLRSRIALPTWKELSTAGGSAGFRRVGPGGGGGGGGGGTTATPETEACTGPFAELLVTVTSAVAAPAASGLNATPKPQEPPAGICAPVQEAVSDRSNWVG